MQSTPSQACCDDEAWIPVRGQEDRYEVSSCGRVRSIDRLITDTTKGYARDRFFRGRILKPYVRKHGHLQINISDRSVKGMLVHRVVAFAFLGDPETEDLVVCHNDGDPQNNHASNLRWDTQSANLLDTLEHGTNYWRNRTHCINGHEYTNANTSVYGRNGRSYRVCNTCRSIKRRKSA